MLMNLEGRFLSLVLRIVQSDLAVRAAAGILYRVTKPMPRTEASRIQRMVKVIHIDAPIGNAPGEISSKSFRSQLPADGGPIQVRFHSEGGSVFESFAILDAITDYQGPKSAIVSSMAFSAASLLLCAFDDVEITANGYTMLHHPHIESEDMTPSDKRLLAQLRTKMISIYAHKTGKSTAIIARLLDQETFFDAEASVDLGLVSRVASRSSLVSARLPNRVLARLRTASTGRTATSRWKAAVDAAMPRCKSRMAAVSMVNRENPGLRQAFVNEVNARP